MILIGFLRIRSIQTIIMPLRYALLLLLILATMGCGKTASQTDNRKPYGPMAVIDSPGTAILDARGGEGIVKISERCVQLQLTEGTRGRKNLLIWNSGTAKWNAKEKAVEFKALGEESSLIRDGDVITVGGSALVNKKVKWLKKPDKNCQGHRWIVDSLERVGN